MAISQYIVLRGRRVRIRCPRCKGYRYHAIASGVRQKNVRCQRCGKTTLCRFEHRSGKRESCAMPAEVIFSPTRSARVHLCNMSPHGLGILVRGLTRSFHPGQELLVRYKSMGKNITRKVRVVNVSPGRIGVQFTDSLFSGR